MTNTDIVRHFCDAWKSRNTDEILGYMSEDCFYHNIPIDPLVGKPAIQGFIDGFMTILEDVEFVMLNISESASGVVLTERVDRLKMKGKWIELPVMGAFELKAGKITHWRDYYDQRTMETLMAG
jgi:limonene-1,2-epoxide hydrolase